MADCLKCRYYRVTWDVDHPRGCSAMGFKGAVLPAHEVQRISGTDCQCFEPKEPVPASTTAASGPIAPHRRHWVG
ncbi:MAG: hypothetical protein HQL60_06800 [Magnetococcales bacterium]|nr:hypothetical protein [Magnetococcales bacterium]